MTGPRDLDLVRALAGARRDLPPIQELTSPMLKALRPRTYLQVGAGCATDKDTFTAATIYAEHATCVDPDLPGTRRSSRSASYGMDPGRYLNLSQPGQPRLFDLTYVKDRSHDLGTVLARLLDIERHSKYGAVTIVDGALPYDDRASDLWKLYPALSILRPDLELALVSTRPAGALVIRGLDKDKAESWPTGGHTSVRDVLDTTAAWGDDMRDLTMVTLVAIAVRPDDLSSRLNVEGWGRGQW
jgi:hypothetical protein